MREHHGGHRLPVRRAAVLRPLRERLHDLRAALAQQVRVAVHPPVGGCEHVAQLRVDDRVERQVLGQAAERAGGAEEADERDVAVRPIRKPLVVARDVRGPAARTAEPLGHVDDVGVAVVTALSEHIHINYIKSEQANNVMNG